MVYNPQTAIRPGLNFMSFNPSMLDPQNPTAQPSPATNPGQQVGPAIPPPGQQAQIDATTGMPAPYIPANDDYGFLDDRQAAGFGRFFTSPDYQFRMNEGVRAVDQSGAARGSLMSGNQLKELTRYGQNLAAGEYGDYMNRMFSVAGLGQPVNTGQAAAGGGQAFNQMFNAAGALGTNTGNIIGAGNNAQQNIWGNALGNIDFGGVAQGIGGLFGGGSNAAPASGFNLQGNPGFSAGLI